MGYAPSVRPGGMIDTVCEWSNANRKHCPYHGMKREHTRHGAARYLDAYDAAGIRALETKTVREPDRARASSATRSEYLREVGAVIGWDQGVDATLSFVSCSGGELAGRAYHGQPVHRGDSKAQNWEQDS